MITFQGFKPSGMQKIADSMGFQGNMQDFQKFLQDNPDRQSEMMRYQDMARKMVEGGYVNKMSKGGSAKKDIRDISSSMVTNPKLPAGAKVTPYGIPTGDKGQMIDRGSGQVTGTRRARTEKAATAKAEAAGKRRATIQPFGFDPRRQQSLISRSGQPFFEQDIDDPNVRGTTTMDADTSIDKVTAVTDALEAAQTDPNDPRAKVNAQAATKSLVGDLEAAQGTGIILNNPMQREIQQGELISGVADATKAAKFTEQVQAATATPTENLSNRQQRAMLAAQQRATFMGMEFDQAFQARVQNASRIADAANMNFTAEQQIALENSRIANTMELANLGNRQAKVMAEAASLANLDTANLNNRQQAQVMNAQNFMQRDLANLSNQQQAEIFRTQQRVQSLFTDQAAVNAAEQFNATSENQTKQFFAQLDTQVSQFNAAQENTEVQNQRDQFNANNRLVIDQANAQWRRQIATADTAAINRANEINAQNLLGISNTAYNNLWQYYSDAMQYAWTSAENERDRVVKLAEAHLVADSSYDIQKLKNDHSSATSFGKLIGTFLFSSLNPTSNIALTV
jgi:hypothetical protein